MADLSKTIAPKSDQLNSDDLITGPRTIKVTKISLAAGDQPIAVNYEGDNGKPFKPCKSMRRVMVMVWGSDGNAYTGKRMTLYRDTSVKFGGAEVGGIRISHMDGLKESMTVALTASKSVRKPYTVKPLGETVAEDPETEGLKRDGKDAAMQGVKPYTDWLVTLTPEQKDKIKVYHKEWSVDAKNADAEAVQSDEETGL